MNTHKTRPSFVWLTFTRDTPTPHSPPRPPPFTFSPFLRQGCVIVFLLGHTHEMFVLRNTSALPIARERTMLDLLELGKDHVTSCWPCHWVNLCLLSTVRTLGACAPTWLRNKSYPTCSEAGRTCQRSVTKVVHDARCLASRFGNKFSRLVINLVRVGLTQCLVPGARPA